MRRRVTAVGLVLAALVAMLGVPVEPAAAVPLVGARRDLPHVLTGAQLTGLTGLAPQSIVAFAHSRVAGSPVWTQVPVQIDERKVVGFGTFPPNNTDPGTNGTVYGAGSSGPTELQYADPNTWVGADTNATFDADDELAFMVADSGDELQPGDPIEPAGVVPGSGFEVALTDPLTPGATGWVYLFRSAGSLTPSAGADYVSYQFDLTSGPYKTTYKRRTGPNPETSKVTTANYEIGYTDRWFENSWKIDAGSATGVDILDGHKNQFSVSDCGRSNATFAAEEGAFIANIDGPVRGIRSYVGANSGPRTQRTHLMYRASEQIVTDLRVHAIPAIMDFLDYSSAASGMTYQSSTVPAGVAINGVADSITTAAPTWEAVTGPQGSLTTTVQYSSSINPPGGFDSKVQWFYRDQASPPETQCWGDGSFLGASGPTITGGIENTDPAVTPFATLRGVRTVGFDAPPANPSLVDDQAAAWSGQVRTPLGVVVTPLVAEAVNVVSVGAAAIVEGDTGKPNTLKFAVTLSQPATSTVTVGYAIRATGSANAPADFTAKTGTVTFIPAGGETATVKYVAAKVAPDATVEPNETFEVVLSNPTGGYALGSAIAVGSIIDDEAGPKPSISVGDASIWEGDAGKTATAYNNGSAIVSLSAPATTTVTVLVTAGSGTATSGIDYKPVIKMLTFKPGQMSKAFALGIRPDLGSEPDETVVLTLSAPTGAVALGRSVGTISILDDD